MSESLETLGKLAQRLNKSVPELLPMLENAGIHGKSQDDDSITFDERRKFLIYIRKTTGSDAKSRTSSGSSGSETATRSGIAVEVRPDRKKQRLSILQRERKAAEAAKAAKSGTEDEDKKPISVEPEPVVETPEIEQVDEVRKEAIEEIKEADSTDSGEIVPDSEVEVATPAEAELPSEEVATPADQKKVKAKKVQPETEAKPKKAPRPEKGRKEAKVAKKSEKEELHLDEKLQSTRKKTKTSRSTKDSLGKKHAFTEPAKPRVYEVPIADSITVGELAQLMSVKSKVVMDKWKEYDTEVSSETELEFEAAKLIVEELGHIAKRVPVEVPEPIVIAEDQDDRVYTPRIPVVTVMGHVDHGKTTLLDYIRESKVASGEQGGITQHIGAYMVDTPRGQITFFDTPGHEAFTDMRSRGANVTDIVILVVAADDGVKPQTVEAIKLSQLAKVPIVVAVNKIDKDGVDPTNVVNELLEYDVVAESLGGEVQVVEISALQGTGVDALLEAVANEADLMELTAPEQGQASGTVIEVRKDTGRGPVATVLVQKGEICKGNTIVAGLQQGRIRALKSDRGERVDSAGPSVPLEVEGLGGMPKVGDEFVCVPDKKKAVELVAFRKVRARQEESRVGRGVYPEDWGGDQLKILNLVIKADNQGPAGALSTMLTGLSNEEVEVKVVHVGVGGINQTDAELADTTGAVLVGFNVRADAVAAGIIEKKAVRVIYSSVVYEMEEDIKSMLQDMQEPEIREVVVGMAAVREVFPLTSKEIIAGCLVETGAVKRNFQLRVLRDQVVVHKGMINSIRRFKADVPEVKAGLECGIGIRNFNDVKIGDRLEVFQETRVR